MAAPLNVLIPRTTEGVMRARSKDAPATKTHHHAAEPRSTPSVTEAGLSNEPDVPKPRVAARAANDRIVVGFVIVNPTVDA